jgi:hypothetical protein
MGFDIDLISILKLQSKWQKRKILQFSVFNGEMREKEK